MRPFEVPRKPIWCPHMMEPVSMLSRWLINNLDGLILLVIGAFVGAVFSWWGSFRASKRYYVKAANDLRAESAVLRSSVDDLRADLGVLRRTIVNIDPDRFELAPDGSVIVKSRGDA
jgi:hypothetical protein